MTPSHEPAGECRKQGATAPQEMADCAAGPLRERPAGRNGFSGGLYENFSRRQGGQMAAGSVFLLEPEGDKAELLARLLWLDMDARHRRQALWDVKMRHKAACMAAHFRNAAYCAFCMEKKAWLERPAAGLFIVRKDGNCGAAHFALARNIPGLERTAALALRSALGRFERIMACVPVHWRGAAALAARLGFRKTGIARGHCWLEEYGRYADGHVFVLERGDSGKMPAPAGK